MTSRLLAFVLAFIIGSPACWCCVPSAPQARNAKHACCEESRDESLPASPAPKDPCPCGASMIRREMAKTIVDVPPPMFSGLDHFPVCEIVRLTPEPILRAVSDFYDTGPPHVLAPIFIRQHSLLI